MDTVEVQEGAEQYQILANIPRSCKASTDIYLEVSVLLQRHSCPSLSEDQIHVV